MTHVLVTGGAGFIGSHVTSALQNAGHQVSVLDAGHPAAHTAAPPDTVHGVPVRRADIRDRAAVADALAGVEAVVHQAAMVGMGVDLDDLPEYAACAGPGLPRSPAHRSPRPCAPAAAWLTSQFRSPSPIATRCP